MSLSIVTQLSLQYRWQKHPNDMCLGTSATLLKIGLMALQYVYQQTFNKTSAKVITGMSVILTLSAEDLLNLTI